jgi:hypothetical protein
VSEQPRKLSMATLIICLSLSSMSTAAQEFPQAHSATSPSETRFSNGDVVTDVSDKFKTAWRNTGPKPAMPADDPETALLKMQLRWIGWGECKPPDCEP